MLYEKAKETIKRYNLLKDNESLLIGVSGGPDSMALLCLCNALKKDFKLKLHVGHLDHMLRDDSHADCLFVQGTAKRLGIPFTSARINIKTIPKKGSLEETARTARLGFLFKVAGEIGAKKIALGHNRNDQAETILMRLLRGTGLSGLTAMLPRKKFQGFEIIRPLIEISRGEIENFLRMKKIRPRIDKSNLEDIYFRNRIRNKLIPELEKEYNPKIMEILAHTAESVACDYDYLLKSAQSASNKLGKKISLRKFSGFHPAIQRMLIRLRIAGLQGDTRRITYRHIREIEDLVTNRPANSRVDLPRGISVLKKNGRLLISVTPNSIG